MGNPTLSAQLAVPVGMRPTDDGDVPWYMLVGAPIAAYQPKGAADLAASYINLANPGTFNAAPGVAPSFASSTGWTFDGTTQYLTTGITPGDGWSMLVQYTGVPATNAPRTIAGCQSAVPDKRFYLRPTTASDAVSYAHQDLIVVAPRLTAGNLGLAGQQGYRNGAADGAAIATTGGTYVAMYIGASNNGGTTGMFCLCNIQALIIYNATLNAGQMATMAAAMAAL